MRILGNSEAAVARRFWSKVAKGDGCWLWSAATDSMGYGLLWAGRYLKAHRYSWVLHNGAVPDGLKVLHKCDVRACVNPDHLFLGTQADNMRDAVSKGRMAQQWDSARNRSAALKRAKLTPDAVAVIKHGYAAGVRVPSLALSHGVTVSAIYKVLQGRRWTGGRV